MSSISSALMLLREIEEEKELNREIKRSLMLAAKEALIIQSQIEEAKNQNLLGELQDQVAQRKYYEKMAAKEKNLEKLLARAETMDVEAELGLKDEKEKLGISPKEHLQPTFEDMFERAEKVKRKRDKEWKMLAVPPIDGLATVGLVSNFHLLGTPKKREVKECSDMTASELWR